MKNLFSFLSNLLFGKKEEEPIKLYNEDGKNVDEKVIVKEEKKVEEVKETEKVNEEIKEAEKVNEEIKEAEEIKESEENPKYYSFQEINKVDDEIQYEEDSEDSF